MHKTMTSTPKKYVLGSMIIIPSDRPTIHYYCSSDILQSDTKNF